MKVERVSYDVMTPSAARAVFESILWKPAIRWRVQRIEVLRPIRFINLRRNEVSAVVSTRNVQQAMAAGSGTLGLYIEDERQQRAGYFLRDVAYRIHADLALALGCTEPLVKYTEMFTRRAREGQCVKPALFGLPRVRRRLPAGHRRHAPSPAIEDTRELGWMLHDLEFFEPTDPQPRFFNAKMERGVVQVPSFEETRG